MRYPEVLKEKICDGLLITKEEAMNLYLQPLEELCAAACELRRVFCAKNFDICTIINAKSGKCSENCKFCAQSSFYKTGAKEYELSPFEEIAEKAKYDYLKGASRCGIVTSGKNLSNEEVEEVCKAIKKIKTETNMAICASLGLLNFSQYEKLKAAGLSRVHNNLETSENYFSKICTTHTFSDKIESIKAAQKAGLYVCSGGVMGIGESVEDRIDMAFSLKELKIKSVPINILNPIAGTPLEKNSKIDSNELQRIIAVYRFILPDAYIRLAGGRKLLKDKGRSCFTSGANALISGNMLTTAGIDIKTDIEMLSSLGFEVKNNAY